MLRFYDEGRKNNGFEAGIEMGVRAMLASPKFVFRVERDPAGIAAGQAYTLSDLELASRLSFFLWSSIPDEELLATGGSRPAARSQNAGTANRAHVGGSEIAGAGDEFRGAMAPDTQPAQRDARQERLSQISITRCGTAFARELELFVGSIIRENRSVLELLTADYTFVNERLALHYGIPNIYRQPLPQGLGYR